MSTNETKGGQVPIIVRLPRVVAVQTLPDYKLQLRFEKGEERVFDMTPYLRDGTVFEALRAQAEFDQATVSLGTVCWPNGADIAPETLFDKSE